MSATVIKLSDRRKPEHPKADVFTLPLLALSAYLAVTAAYLQALIALSRNVDG